MVAEDGKFRATIGLDQEEVPRKVRKVTFLSTDLAYGGAESQLVQLAIRLKRRSWDVKVVSMLPPQAYARDLRNMEIPVYSLDMIRGLPDPRSVFRLASILRDGGTEVLHAHMFHANLLARLVRLLVPIAVVICTAHSTYEVSSRTREPREFTWRELAYRFTDPLCDLTTHVSKLGLERYVRVRAVPSHKIRFIPNGVDTDKFRPQGEIRDYIRTELGVTKDEFLWLAVGRLEQPKDYPSMLKAFAEVVREKDNAVLLIAGEGQLRQEIEMLAENLGLKNSVRLLGLRTEVPMLMSASDGYVISSVWEGLPMVVLEAAASALPIVATNVGDIPEIVRDGENGFLVPPNHPELLARAMLRLMSLPLGVRKRMGDLSRVYIERSFSLEKIVDQWEILYWRLLARKKKYTEPQGMSTSL